METLRKSSPAINLVFSRVSENFNNKLQQLIFPLKIIKSQSEYAEVNMILETDRLYLREMQQSDFGSLCKILQDEDTMYAYNGAFSDDEVQEWLDRQIYRYQKWNFGLWAVILKETDEMIGQCGLTMQPWKDAEVLEIGYLFERSFWHKGYAIEAAAACKKYAFEVLKADEVCSIIRDTNTASQNVAVRNGMAVVDTWTKHYRGVDMPHFRYASYH
jgi:ribosomal-protein-alanine N-acetyltransferase